MQTGFKDLDKIIDINGEKLIILGSRPAMGKSTLALNILSNIAIKQNEPVLYFNLESSREIIANRLLKTSRIFIVDKAGISINEICKEARRMKFEQDIKFIVIDYLQLISYVEKNCLSRDLQIKEILKKLKILSKELNLPILVLSQLSRKPEQRENHRPIITDFSESKVGITNYVDIVLLLYRDEYYNSDTCKNNIAEIIIAKNPSRLGTIEIAWMPEYLKFGNLLKIR